MFNQGSNRIELELELPDIEVLDVGRSCSGSYEIWISSTKGGTECHKCGNWITKYHGKDRILTIRHLPILGHACYLKLEPRRYICPNCSCGVGKSGRVTTTESLSWYNSGNSLSLVYENHLLLELVNSTVKDVSEKEGIGYALVENVLRQRIPCEVEWSEIESLDVLGIDEISLKKGHKDFVAIITSRQPNGDIILLAVLADRSKESVFRFFDSIPFRLHVTIDTVCSDMWQAYLNSAKEAFKCEGLCTKLDSVQGVKVQPPSIVVDRFHVAQKYRGCLDKLRKQVMKRLKNELSEDDYKAFKGIQWLLRRHPDDLQTHEVAILDKLFALVPELKMAYDFSNQLTQIFDTHQTPQLAQKRFNAWICRVQRQNCTCFDSFITTLNNHFTEIINYFRRRLSSGFVEGLNNKIKVIKRRCYGILDTNSLFRRISLDLNGYRWFKHQFTPSE